MTKLFKICKYRYRIHFSKINIKTKIINKKFAINQNNKRILKNKN